LAGAPPYIPLGKLLVIPRLPSWIFGEKENGKGGEEERCSVGRQDSRGRGGRVKRGGWTPKMTAHFADCT